MSEQDQQSRTEEATDKRLADARGDGNVPASREVPNFLYLMAALLVIAVLGQTFASHLGGLLVGLLANVGSIHLGNGGDVMLLFDVVGNAAAGVTAPIILAFSAAGIIASVVQNPPVPVAKRVMPDMSRLSPSKGLKRIFSLSGLFEFLKLSLRLVVVVVTSVAILMYMWHDFTNSVWNDPSAILALSQKSVVALLTALALLSFTLLIFDLPVAHVLWRRSLRMARQEIKDEHKETEGSPEAKGAQRQRQREMARRSVRKAVAEAHVVLTNPTHFAVALRYDRSSDQVPVVVAKGRGATALAIRDVAGDAAVPVLEYPALARAIYFTSREGQEVRDDLYLAIASVLAFVFNLNAKAGGSPPPIDVPASALFDENGVKQG